MRKTLITVAVVGLCLIAGPAYAGGSDSPTPYSVTTEGITLPDGVTFEEHGHVNVRTESGAGRNIHFESFSEWVGKSFIPWSAFNLHYPECIAWVQIHGFNEHFGEGGQSPVCLTDPTPPVVEEPQVTEEPPVVEEPPVEVEVPDRPDDSIPPVIRPLPEMPVLAETGLSEKQTVLVWILGLAGGALLLAGLSLKLNMKEV